MGNGTWSLTGVGSNWDMTTTTNLTFDAGGSTLQWTHAAPTATRSFITGGLTYANFYVAGQSPTGATCFSLPARPPFTGTFTVNGGANILLPNALTTTINNLVVNGTASAPASLLSASTTAPPRCRHHGDDRPGAALRWMTFTGGPTATNSFDLGSNSGITITRLPAAADRPACRPLAPI
jgi:hypothetical protein